MRWIRTSLALLLHRLANWITPSHLPPNTSFIPTAYDLARVGSRVRVSAAPNHKGETGTITGLSRKNTIGESPGDPLYYVELDSGGTDAFWDRELTTLVPGPSTGRPIPAPPPTPKTTSAL